MAGQFIKQASLIGCCAAAIAVSSSAANAQTRVFDLPPANAVETIPAFAQQSGLQILAPADRIVGVRTPAIKGAYDARAALRKLIANTGLVISSDTGSTIILKWQEPKRVSATTAAPLSAAKSVTSTAAVQPVAEAAALEPPLEDIVVLGSRIRGAAPVGSTVLDLDRADIEELPAVTTGDIIQTMPSVINLGNSESSRAAGGGGNFTFAQGINIHGVGNGATLMLIDGRRVVPQGTIGSINDSSLIPANALERVEIVPDGASALYGSDAMAGVANLVIRRDYDGLELTGRQGFADDYSETQLGASFGADWSSGKFGLVYNYSYHTDLNASDRGYATADLSGRGGDDYRGSQCSPPTLVAGGVTYALPSGGLNEANAGDLVAGSINSCDIYANADLIPEVERHNVVATFDQDITDTLSVAATGFYAKRSVYMTAGLTTATFTVPDTNAYYVSSISGPQTIQYAFADMATNDTDASNEFYQGTVEADWVLPFDWRINGAFTYGYSEDARAITRGLYNSAFTAALASSDPATAFNPYGGANDPALLDSLAQSVGGYFTGDSKQWVVDLGADGPLFDLPGGTVRLAAGYQHLNVRSRIFVRIGTNDSYFISTAADHTRKVDSGYAELLVPIFGPGNAIPGFQRLDLNIAGRFDSYNDSGSTTNPKIGVTWEPVSGLSLHGSYGKSFRAPNIASAFASGGLQVGQFVDPLAGGAIVDGILNNGGRPGLEPETATTFSFGADFRTGENVRFSGSVNYFNIKYKDIVTGIGTNYQVLNQADLYDGLGLIVRDPSDEYLDQLFASFPFLGSVLPEDIAVYVDGRSINMSTKDIDGIDFSADVMIPLDGSDLQIGVNGLFLLTYDTMVTPNAPVADQLNTILYPVAFTARQFTRWSNDTFNVGAYLNYTGSYTNNLVSPSEKVGDFMTVDAHFGVELEDLIPGPIGRDFSLSFDVKNLFDADPPFVNVAPSSLAGGGYDASMASPLGRIVMIGFKKTF